MKKDGELPIGVKPRSIIELEFNKVRTLDLLSAMVRYVKADKEIPDVWWKELTDLRVELQALSTKESKPSVQGGTP